METLNFGYCGINCEACSVRQFGLGNSKDDFIHCMVAVPEAELKCDGCKSGSVYPGCRICNIRRCAEDLRFSHCGECPDFPCRPYKQWNTLSKILPHVKNAKENLETMNRDGIDSWASIQRLRWACPVCKQPFAWYSTKCGKCGEVFTFQNFKMTRLSRFLCRIILPWAFKKGKNAKRP